jgi:hypothetical protein
MNIINGSSSLLFIINTIKAFYCSNLLTWKLSNCFLVVASFLCNAYEYKSPYLFLDYLAIFLISTSYINNISINVPYTLFIIYEYKDTNSIEVMKNIACATAIGKTVIYTYLYVDKLSYYIALSSAISGTCVYTLRVYLHKNNNKKYTLLLTYILHISIMNLLYIASSTAS